MKQYLNKTFLQLGRGFQFSAPPPPSLADAANLTSKDPWTVLGSVLLRAQQGDFAVVEVLPELMMRDHGALVWNACIQLIGFAGSRSLVLDTAQRFLSNPGDLGVQWYIGDLLRNGCTLRAVGPLLDLHAAATDQDARRHIEHCLSTVLEEEPGDLDQGPEEHEVPDPDYPEPFTEYRTVLDRAGYTEQVRAVSEQVAQGLASPDQPVTAGQALDLQGLASRLHARIRSGAENSSRMEWERMCFEAFTGVDCSGFYREGNLQRLAALAVLEGFLDSRAGGRFEVGVRYFFGRPVEA